jgi:hypothetical protein
MTRAKKAPAPEAAQVQPGAPALDAMLARTALEIIADGGPMALIWARLAAEHGAQISEGGHVTIHGIETKAAMTLDEGLRLWGSKARRALLAVA